MWKNGTNFSYKSGSSSFLYQFMLKISAKYGKIRKNSCFSWIFFDIRNVNLLYSSLFEKIAVFLLQLGVCFYARNWLHKIPQRPLAWNNCRDNPILCRVGNWNMGLIWSIKDLLRLYENRHKIFLVLNTFQKVFRLDFWKRKFQHFSSGLYSTIYIL